MDDGLIWILAGVGLLVAEMLVPGVYLLWIGIAAIGTGLVVLALDPSFGATVVVFLALLAAGIGVALVLRKRQHPQVRVNTPDAGLVGRLGTITERTPAGARVRVGDSDWAARIAGAADVGETVRVDGVDGTVLVVSRVGR
jgi:membrane protein implicated in regulation of membrane protease activity